MPGMPTRVAERITPLTDATPAGSLAILGLPEDLGIALNNGRTGAAKAPNAFRQAMLRYGMDFDTLAKANLTVNIVDAGDITPAAPEEFGDGREALIGALHETHRRTSERARLLHQRGLIVVGIGGGHDLTLPTVRALAEVSGGPVGGINVDAHLDVRPEPGSGMPYRVLIEHKHVDPTRFVEFGIGRFTCLREHVEWLHERGGTIVTADEAIGDRMTVEQAFATALPRHIEDGREVVRDGFVSIDLDAIDAGMAPGVSAVNPMGLPVPLVARIAERAGRHPGVRHFDLMELSPPHDVESRTARLAVHLFMHFIAGVAMREIAQ